MKQEVHEFEKSLKKGKKGEQAFLELFGDKVERLDGFIVDFKIKRTGKTLELKTDSYDPTKTRNLFMERYSYGNEPGGAHQALKKGADYFVYWFPITNEFFVFKTAELVKRLDEVTEGAYVINVRNSTHTTRGFKVDRGLLLDIALNLEDIL